jgi:DNA-binding transcriptional LysR family regulator
MNIALKQIRVFVTVAQERTITAAAEKLFLSKPAVSMALAELEKQLGHKVFDRNNNRLLINEYGRRLLPLADELLTRSHNIEIIFDDTAPMKGCLKIGSSDTIGNQLTPYLLRDFRQQSQHYDQSLVISNSHQITQKILEFELDIGLVEGNIHHDDLITIPWLKDEMVIAMAINHPMAQAQQAEILLLEKQSWILREEGSGTRTFFFNHLATQLMDWQVVFELNTTEAILNAVSAELGISCLSNLATQSAVKQGRLITQSFSEKAHRQYWIVYHKEKYQSPLIQGFLSFCQQWQFPMESS